MCPLQIAKKIEHVSSLSFGLHELAVQVADQISFRHFFLSASAERLHRIFPARNFIFAQNDCTICAKLVGLAERLANLLLDGWQFNSETGAPQLCGSRKRGGMSFFAHPYNENALTRCFQTFIAFLQREN